MKRLLLLFVLLLAVPAAFAQANGNVLLTDEGVVYTASAEWSHEHPDVEAASNTFLLLTVREADKPMQRVVVPGTTSYGANSQPALAYDDETGTLHVFWQYSENAMSSELRFISRDREGNWSFPNAFETAAYRLRRNLRIALTHFATDTGHGSAVQKRVSEKNVHATWWESSAAGARARYAMLTPRPGETFIQVRDLSDFVKEGSKYDVAEDFNIDILRHPALFESSGGDSIDVVFGEVETNSLHRITVKPIGNARVRIPVGVQDKGFRPPSGFAANATGRIDAISPHPDRLLYYFEDEGVMRYVVHRNDAWSAVRTIRLDDGMTREMAVGAMRGLVGGH